ncbi:hypothetical protein C8J57DRAFT_468799 [Mycena rebaudengoi]|nr:hypothetical protein C8J57DRAFT_468799 [Mycena rebaudengoi]
MQISRTSGAGHLLEHGEHASRADGLFLQQTNFWRAHPQVLDFRALAASSCVFAPSPLSRITDNEFNPCKLGRLSLSVLRYARPRFLSTWHAVCVLATSSCVFAPSPLSRITENEFTSCKPGRLPQLFLLSPPTLCLTSILVNLAMPQSHCP